MVVVSATAMLLTGSVLVCEGSELWTPVLEAWGVRVPQPGTTDLQATVGDARQLSDMHRCHNGIKRDGI